MTTICPACGWTGESNQGRVREGAATLGCPVCDTTLAVAATPDPVKSEGARAVDEELRK